MEDFERKLKRAGFRCRRDRTRADAPPVDTQKKERSASVVRKKLKVLGIDRGICLGCGSADVSTFQFDHTPAASTTTSFGLSVLTVTRRKLSWVTSIHRPPPTRTTCST
jgi:hypothetical protein